MVRFACQGLKVFILGMAAMLRGYAVSPTPSELSEARRWVKAKLEAKIEPRPIETYLEVKTEGGKLRENGRYGGPLRIFNKAYKHGLFMDGVHSVTVRLPAPAKTLSATVGLDGGYSGCGYTSGRQRFWVEVGGRKLFDSGVVKVMTPGVAINVDLNGTSEFTLGNAEGTPEGEKQAWCEEACGWTAASPWRTAAVFGWANCRLVPYPHHLQKNCRFPSSTLQVPKR